MGVRLAYANETDEGCRLAPARLKDLTGGDTLTGRVPYGKSSISFSPTHKLVVVGNYKPVVGDHSEGMWRRIALVPFEQTIPEADRDRRLLDKLMREGSGILNWLLKGLAAWSTSGLQIPAEIKAFTAAYRDEEDILGDFLDESCTVGVGCSVKKQELYCQYKTWAEIFGFGLMSQSTLTRRLKLRGISVAPDKRTYLGLRLDGRQGLLR